MTADLEARMAECAGKAQVTYEVAERWSFGGERFDESLVGLLRDTARELGVAQRDILAQAGHDAFNVARAAPACMLFCPCEKGISHNEAENCRLEDVEPSVNVLLHAVLARANA
jgi:N-carbamoyl-L-amino-acid hydrolase